MARSGFVRIELKVRKDDASLIRDIAAALSDSARQTAARAFLQQCFSKRSTLNLKALLASAPLEGIVLERSCDSGRDADF
jgi:hypothetical protein